MKIEIIVIIILAVLLTTVSGLSIFMYVRIRKYRRRIKKVNDAIFKQNSGYDIDMDTENLKKIAEEGESVYNKETSAEDKAAENDEMVRKITHSIRMPMAIITGYGDLLQRGRYGSPEGLEYIDKICSNVHLLNEALASYLSKNKNQKEADEAERQLVDIVEVINHVENDTKELLNSIGIKLIINSARSNAFVTGNRIEFITMFYNLIENSIKYMMQGNRIYITTEDAGDCILVVYRDNGVGIKSDEAELITERGKRGEAAIQRGIEGNGMGMYMMASVVKKYGGSYEIKSSRNEGIAIYFRFVKEVPLRNI